MIDFNQYAALSRQGNWTAVHALLDDAREKALTPDERSTEVYLRVSALKKQDRFDEALDLLEDRGRFYNSKSLAQHDKARILHKLGRGQEALDAMNEAPYEAEMTSFPVLAMDAKFFHCALLAENGDPSVKDRLNELPDDYRHVTIDGDLLTKADVSALITDLCELGVQIQTQ